MNRRINRNPSGPELGGTTSQDLGGMGAEVGEQEPSEPLTTGGPSPTLAAAASLAIVVNDNGSGGAAWAFSTASGQWTQAHGFDGYSAAQDRVVANGAVGLVSAINASDVWGFSALTGTWARASVPGLTGSDPMQASGEVGMVVCAKQGMMWAFNANNGTWTNMPIGANGSYKTATASN